MFNAQYSMFNKISIFTIALLAMLSSCESPDLSNLDDSDTEANLRVSIYQMGSTPFSALTRATDNCTHINYAVYTMDGTRVKQINQQSGAADFGSAVFQLGPDTYQLVVVAHSSNGNPTMTNPQKVQFTNSQGFTDTFLHYQTVQVTEEEQNLSVTLDRIVSLCRVVFTDALPADVATLQFQYTGGSGVFDATTGFGCVKSTQKMTFNVESGQKEFDLYTFLHRAEDTIHLKVTALDSGGNVLYEREFDVPMKYNQITWFSGPFFGGGTGSTAITITINTDWAGETHVTF
jgi:hypothetical protein